MGNLDFSLSLLGRANSSSVKSSCQVAGSFLGSRNSTCALRGSVEVVSEAALRVAMSFSVKMEHLSVQKMTLEKPISLRFGVSC